LFLKINYLKMLVRLFLLINFGIILLWEI
jgi:hypothetical protein